MKSLTTFFLFIFVLITLVSCEPEEISNSKAQEVSLEEEFDVFAETGDQKKEVDDDKGTE